MVSLDEKGRATWGEDKLVADVDDNLLALINAINRRRELERTILLDGHFVLRSATGSLIRLATDVFSSLRLSGVILLCDNAEIIAARLARRDGISTGLESIAELAAEEAAHAHDVCRSLDIPLTVIESPTEALLMDAVTRLLAEAGVQELHTTATGQAAAVPYVVTTPSIKT